MEKRTELLTRLNAMATALGNHPRLVCVGTNEMSQDAWRGFAVERYLTAMVFESLLDAAIAGAQHAHDAAIADALTNNRNDELGIVDGVQDVGRSHAAWRRDFYDALGITDEMLNAHISSTAVKAYMDVMRSVIATGDYLVMTGTLLALERFFPVEFTIMQKGRDLLFADAMHTNPRARLYLDDHILHDANAHYPDLLAAVEPHVAHEADMARLLSGIDAAESAKRAFYDTLTV